MKGAREYAHLFKRGITQYGRLLICMSDHARGYTLNVWVLKEGVERLGTYPSESEGVEVYGVISGQPGWTESYGWLHQGPWEEDFAKLVRSLQLEKDARDTQNQAMHAESERLRKESQKQLLSTYKSEPA